MLSSATSLPAARATVRPRRWYLALAAVLAGMLALMFYAYTTGQRMVALVAPRVSAAADLQVEILEGHLLLEEMLSGERPLDLDGVRDHYRHAAALADALLAGGESQFGHVHPAETPGGRGHLEKVGQGLQELEGLSRRRAEAGAQGRGESAAEGRYHELFEQLMATAGAVERSVNRDIRRETAKFHATHLGLLGLGLAGAALVAGVFAYFERKARRDLRDLDAERQRRAAGEMRFRTLFEHVTDPLYVCDGEGRLVDCNRRACAALGYSRDELLTLAVADVEVGHSPEAAEAIRARLVPGESALLDGRHRRKDGTTFPVEVHLQRFEDEGRPLVIGIARDRTERQRAEDALRQAQSELEDRVRKRTAELEEANLRLAQEAEEHRRTEARLRYSEEKYSTLVENLPAGVFIFRENRIVFANRAFEQLTGYTAEEISGLEPWPLLHPEDRTRVRKIAEARLAGGEAPADYEVRVLTKAGKPRWLNLRVALLWFRGAPSSLCSAVDITERRRAEEELALSREELRRLSAQLLETQEAERLRVSRDLHDSIGQALSAATFLLDNAIRRASSEGGMVPVRLLEPLVERLQESIEEVRRISMALRPSILDDLGLVATVGWFCREFAAALPGVHVVQQVTAVEAEIPGPLKTAIYRILQEAVHNAAKHSRAGKVWVSLASRAGALELAVRDDGAGFASREGVAEEGGGPGLGLRSMRERAHLSGGTLAVESAPGKGTTVRARWPLPSIT